MGFGVWGLVFGVWGWGLGCGVQGLGLRVRTSELVSREAVLGGKIGPMPTDVPSCLRFGCWGLGFEVWGSDLHGCPSLIRRVEGSPKL